MGTGRNLSPRTGFATPASLPARWRFALAKQGSDHWSCRGRRATPRAVHAIFLVGAGGAIGAVMRYWTSAAMLRIWLGDLPLATFVVNVVGCFAIGLLAGAAETRSVFTDDVRLFLVVGILGGFTTFSSFGFEAFELIRRGHAMLAVFHVAWQCVLGTGAVAVGYSLLRAR